MVNLLVKAYQDAIENLGWIERYGGLVRPVLTQENIMLDGKGVKIPAVYPVSCLIESSCTEPGIYKRLVPDDAYKSVAYFEQRGSGRFTIEGPIRNLFSLTVPLRFVVWLNFKRLGIEGCPDTLPFQLSLANALSTPPVIVDSDLLSQGGSVSVVSFEFPEQRSNLIFAPYSYANKEWAFFPPYGFFALDMTAKITINLACFVEPQLAEPVNCLTQW